MTPIERQMLKNQRIILRYLWLKDNDYTSGDRTLLIETAKETERLLNPKQSDEPCCEMPEEEEEVGCNCGFKVEEGKKGCGKVLDELVERDDDENIIDTRWIHCGEDGELCDECVKQEIEE